MSAKTNSCENDVKKMCIFNDDENKSFPKICKNNSEIDFQSNNFQVSDGSNKSGKSMLCVSKNIFNVHSVLLITYNGKNMFIKFYTFYRN